jgi:putative ATP-dependent endonuclease of the OLD family
MAVTIRIVEVRVQDFRALRDLFVPLTETTVLLGENNAGKTSFLEAIGVALGDRAGSQDDLFVGPGGVPAAEFVIDLLVQPVGSDTFASDITDTVTTGVQLPATGPEYFAIRTRGRLDAARGSMQIKRSFLRGWARRREEAQAVPELARPVPTRDVLDLLLCHLLDARRDIVEQFRNRNTYWARLLAQHGVADALRKTIQDELQELGAQIVRGSPVLQTVADDLKDVRHALGQRALEVELAALPRTLEDLIRSVDVILTAPDSSAFSVARHGMGTRSLAALLVFRSFVRTRLATGAAGPVSCFEEPEAHLHPQAQRVVFDLIAGIPGQRLLSTHSPHVASICDVFDYRLFRRRGSAVEVSWIPRTTGGAPTFSPEEVADVQRFVQNRNAETFFARLVVLFEGDTEEASLPVFAERHWKTRADTRGISFVNVGGAGNYGKFVRLLQPLRIPWLIFSDGDAEGLKGVKAAGDTIGAVLDPTSAQVVALPGGHDFEAYLFAEGYRAEIEAGIARFFGPSALAEYRELNHGQLKKKGVTRDYQSPGWEDRLAHDFFDRHKGHLGESIAEEIAKRNLPTAVVTLLERADKVLDS